MSLIVIIFVFGEIKVYTMKFLKMKMEHFRVKLINNK